MSRTEPEHVRSGSRTTLVEHALPERMREERLSVILGTISRRLGRWSWADVHRRIRAGEEVAPFHKGLARVTLNRLAGRGPRKEDFDE